MGDPKRIKEVVEYIIRWLCYDNSEAASRVAYSTDTKELLTHDVLIIPNGHLGDMIILPDLGQVVVEHPAKGKTIIRTDIVYNTFFFISRAEETFNTERDEHNRFLARYSVLGHSNRMQIPLLDEHARLLLKLLNEPLPEPGFNHIYLTHDIDTLSQYRHLRGALGGILRGKGKTVFASWRDIHNDPAYTFPWIIEQDRKVEREKGKVESIYFIKQTKGKGFDYPQYSLFGRDFKRVKKLLQDSGAQFGVHGSYYGNLPKADLAGSTLYRTHYLRMGTKLMQGLEAAGYTDDFTMGFADEAGFRLQTTRAVRWINPRTLRLTNITMHPLIIMDTTLSNENYMNLNEEEAYFLCERLIEKVRLHHGDLCLLWHNNNLTPDTYHKALYEKIINCI